MRPRRGTSTPTEIMLVASSNSIGARCVSSCASGSNVVRSRSRWRRISSEDRGWSSRPPTQSPGGEAEVVPRALQPLAAARRRPDASCRPAHGWRRSSRRWSSTDRPGRRARRTSACAAAITVANTRFSTSLRRRPWAQMPRYRRPGASVAPAPDGRRMSRRRRAPAAGRGAGGLEDVPGLGLRAADGGGRRHHLGAHVLAAGRQVAKRSMAPRRAHEGAEWPGDQVQLVLDDEIGWSQRQARVVGGSPGPARA